MLYFFGGASLLTNKMQAPSEKETPHERKHQTTNSTDSKDFPQATLERQTCREIIFEEHPLDLSICSGMPAAFHVVATGSGCSASPPPTGTGCDLSYNWLMATGTGATFNPIQDNDQYSGTQTPNLQVSALAAAELDGAYFKVAVNTENCPLAYSQPAKLTVFPAPEGNDEIFHVCSDSNVDIDFSDFITNNLESDILWEAIQVSPNIDGVNLGDSGSQTFSGTLTNSSNTMGQVKFEAIPRSTAHNCEGEPFYVTVKVRPALEASIVSNGDLALCDGESRFLSSQIRYGNYPTPIWSIHSTTGIVQAEVDSDTPNTTLVVSGHGTVTVRLDAEDANGCVAEPALLTFDVLALPVVNNFTGNLNPCENTTETYNITDNGDTYKWSLKHNGQNVPLSSSQGAAIAIDWGTASDTPYMLTVTATNEEGCETQKTVEVQVRETANLEIQVSNASCFGGNDGSLTALVNGNSNDYTYSWSNGANTRTIDQLEVGTYTVIVTSSFGCQTSLSATIEQPTELLSESFSEDASCFGENDGRASIEVQGGTAPYSYQWSNNATTASVQNLTAGNYYVTATDANGCQNISQISINQPTQISIELMYDDVSCFGENDGMASVQVEGGIAPYTYQWSNNATSTTIQNLTAGNYSVIVTDANGCQMTGHTTIHQPAALHLELFSTDVSCFGETDGRAAVIVGGGTPPYQYLWSDGTTNPNVQGLEPGNYSVAIRDANGCVATQSFSISEPSPLNAQISATPAGCLETNDGSATVNVQGGTPEYSYVWKNQNNQTVATTATAEQLAVGDYKVLITDANGCQLELLTTVGNSDTTPPVLDCPSYAIHNVYLNNQGTASLNVNQLYDDVYDNCGISRVFYTGGSISRFYDCNWINSFDILTIIAEDSNGNTSFCFRLIQIIDNLAPEVECFDQVVQIGLENDANAFTLSVDNLVESAEDNCNINNISFNNGTDQRTYTCDDAGGLISETIVVTDDSGNATTCNVPIQVTDYSVPELICNSAPVVLNLEAQANIELIAADLVQVTDECGTPSVTFDDGSTSKTVNCQNIDNLEYLHFVATDNSNNSITCSRPVEIIDQTPPTLVSCNSNALYYLSLDTYEVALSASDLVVAEDNCHINSIEFTEGGDSRIFTCEDAGEINVATVVIRDNSDGVAFCTRLIIITDSFNICN